LPGKTLHVPAVASSGARQMIAGGSYRFLACGDGAVCATGAVVVIGLSIFPP